MKLSCEAIEASYRACDRMARRSGSNFYPCFLGLARAKRRAMNALYAFMRYTDDLADNGYPLECRTQWLAQWRTRFQRALLGDFGEPQAPDVRTGRPLLPALADSVKRFRIPPKHLCAVIDGVEMDLTGRRYQTFEELRQYCECVASAVGAACIYIWGFRGEGALEPARKCGIALQLTNILRDLRDDARKDRVYLPLEELRQCGYSVDDLICGVADERFGRLMELQISRAERFYREGAELIEWLEPDGRRTFAMMMATYRALLKKIKRRPGDVLHRRICLSRARKLQIAARGVILPPRVSALL